MYSHGIVLSPRPRRQPGGSRARLLLVDDHRGIRERVHEILAGEFEVAATAANGREALDAARQIDPDAIVLDINMPELNGFETLSELRRLGSRAPVVFLTMINGEQEVREAFRLGGDGYVVKSQMSRDLVSAVGHALHGRRFASSLMALAAPAPTCGHAIHLLGDGDDFIDDVAALFDHALSRGDATSVIARPHVREQLAARLDRSGWNLGSNPRYQAVDVTEALARFMRDGMPDETVLEEIVRELDAYRITAAGSDSRLTIFGVMAGQLCADGNRRGALAIEHAWHRLTHDLPFLTVCGYQAGGFYDAGAAVCADVYAAHSCVSHACNL